MQKKFLMTVVAVLSLCLCGAASAITMTWTGDFNNSFMAPLNWDSQSAPVAGDYAIVRPGSYYQPVFTGTGTTSIASMYIDSAGQVVVNSGTLRMTATLADSGGLAVYNRSLVTDGLTVNGGTFRSNTNIYIGGHGNGTGRVTVNAGARLECGATTTLGYQSANVEGILNVFGGTADLGVGLRIDPAIATAKSCLGLIDVRGAGLVYVDVNGVTVDQMNQLIDAGRFVSEPGYAPVVVDANYTIVPGKHKVTVVAQQVYYATGPTPAAAGGHITFTPTQTLSWVKPFPRLPGDTVTSDVYFGITNPPTTLVASNISASSIVVSTSAENTYYWKVDSRDSNGGTPIVTATPNDPTFSKTWRFDTRITPTTTVGTRNSRQAAFRSNPSDPNAVATLAATATDDGYPSAMTYEWLVTTTYAGEPNVTFAPSTYVLNPTVKFNYTGAAGGTKDYTLTLTASDGAQSSAVRTLTVKTYNTIPSSSNTIYCDAKKWVDDTSVTYLTGDTTMDCKVDYKDLAALALQWLVCNSPDCM